MKVFGFVLKKSFRSQVDGDIVRRTKGIDNFSFSCAELFLLTQSIFKENDKVTIEGKEHTLGPRLGKKGSTGSVHSVVGNPDVVAKVFDQEVKPIDRGKEIKNLQTVGEYHGHTETESGHHVVLATRKSGDHIHDTDAWKNAGTKEEKNAVVAKAQQLTNKSNKYHAKNHDIVHTCVRFISLHSSPYLSCNFSDTHHGNVLFTENEKGLQSAHLVDWGLAKPALKNKRGALTKSTKDDIVRSYSW